MKKLTETQKHKIGSFIFFLFVLSATALVHFYSLPYYR